VPELRDLPIALIREPQTAIRTEMDEGKLAELAESIKAIGLLQPISVKTLGEEFEIVAGHRRYMAHVQLKAPTVRAIVYADGEMVPEAAKLAENIIREDVNDADLAFYFAELMEKTHLDTDGVAAMLHRDRGYVEDRLRLLTSDAQVLGALRRGAINFSVARELNKCPDEAYRVYLLDIACKCGYPARVISRMVAEWKQQNSTPGTTQPAAAPPPEAAAQPDVSNACGLCGGNLDPYNLIWVQVHKHEWDWLVKKFREPQEVGA
jgi:ParB family chromosome partitioning protein